MLVWSLSLELLKFFLHFKCNFVLGKVVLGLDSSVAEHITISLHHGTNNRWSCWSLSLSAMSCECWALSFLIDFSWSVYLASLVPSAASDERQIAQGKKTVGFIVWRPNNIFCHTFPLMCQHLPIHLHNMQAWDTLVCPVRMGSAQEGSEKGPPKGPGCSYTMAVNGSWL